MTTAASLDSTSLRVVPGEDVVVPLHIRNNGSVVEYYEFEVVGPPQGWTQVERLTEGVLPGTTTSTTVTFSPPRDASIPAGEVQFGVVVTPTQHPDQAVVPEGVIDVLPFLETIAEVVPRTTQGRRTGKHRVAIDNRGNVAVQVLLAGAADGNRLTVDAKPPAVIVGPGEAVFADVRARAGQLIWRNRPVTHPFEVVVTPTDSTPVTLQGTFVQGPVVPPWLWKLALALVALALLLVLLWFTVLKPTIESQAEEAVAEEAAAAEEAAGEAEQAAGSAGESAQAAEASADEAKGKPPKPAPALVETPLALRLTTTGSFPGVYRVPEGSTLRLTDLVLGNPQGDFGLVTISVDGEDLFEMALENFRDLDYHFVTPIVVDSEELVAVRTACNRPGRPPAVTPRPQTCDVSLYVGGSLVAPKR